MDKLSVYVTPFEIKEINEDLKLVAKKRTQAMKKRLYK